ncbi:hypothetical protein BKA66DRAFT_615184 [Pyrenochaeta sp. MPI-SDFR-AT-0127]|nr:hypothetical protein BKA66DRAFT_615184 [Pyrenochaeta sp. MPI-SDFR-AT-0127]
MAAPIVSGRAAPAGHAPPPEDFVHYFNHNGQYQLAFSDATAAVAWHQTVTQGPQVDPNADHTIAAVQLRRVDYIATMVEAVYDRSVCQEKHGSRILNIFIQGKESYISPLEIEAACHMLFDLVIQRCRIGFQGQSKFNLLVGKGKDSMDGHVDCTANCYRRITNVIQALREWKSICREMIQEEPKARRLVNAPMKLCEMKLAESKCNKKKASTNKEGKEAKEKLSKIRDSSIAPINNPIASSAVTNKPSKVDASATPTRRKRQPRKQKIAATVQPHPTQIPRNTDHMDPFHQSSSPTESLAAKTSLHLDNDYNRALDGDISNPFAAGTSKMAENSAAQTMDLSEEPVLDFAHRFPDTWLGHRDTLVWNNTAWNPAVALASLGHLSNSRLVEQHNAAASISPYHTSSTHFIGASHRNSVSYSEQWGALPSTTVFSNRRHLPSSTFTHEIGHNVRNPNNNSYHIAIQQNHQHCQQT